MTGRPSLRPIAADSPCVIAFAVTLIVVIRTRANAIRSETAWTPVMRRTQPTVPIWRGADSQSTRVTASDRIVLGVGASHERGNPSAR